jgi:site-specific DNA-adenine methylase
MASIKCPDCGHLSKLHGPDFCLEDSGSGFCGCEWLPEAIAEDEEAEPQSGPETEHPNPDRLSAIEHTLWLIEHQRNPPPPPLTMSLCHQGGKHKCRKLLTEIIESYRSKGQKYIEPFVGGANILYLVGDHGPRIASDLFQPCVSFWQQVQKGWLPEIPTLDEYMVDLERYKHETDFSHLSQRKQAQIMFNAIPCSYGGSYFNRFRYSSTNEDPQAAIRAIKRQRPGIMGVEFHYRRHTIYGRRRGCIFYMDPPYATPPEAEREVRGYDHVGEDFDTPKFWDFCARLVRNGNIVLVSEATPPPKRYVEEKHPYMAGPHGDRQEWLFKVAAV